MPSWIWCAALALLLGHSTSAADVANPTAATWPVAAAAEESGPLLASLDSSARTTPAAPSLIRSEGLSPDVRDQRQNLMAVAVEPMGQAVGAVKGHEQQALTDDSPDEEDSEALHEEEKSVRPHPAGHEYPGASAPAEAPPATNMLMTSGETATDKQAPYAAAPRFGPSPYGYRAPRSYPSVAAAPRGYPSVAAAPRGYPSVASASPGYPSVSSSGTQPFGKDCVIPMWQANTFVCKEHEKVSRLDTYLDEANVARKKMASMTECTVLCPSGAQIPDIEKMTCQDGMWVNAEYMEVTGIKCQDSPWILGGIAITVIVAITCAVLAYTKFKKGGLKQQPEEESLMHENEDSHHETDAYDEYSGYPSDQGRRSVDQGRRSQG